MKSAKNRERLLRLIAEAESKDGIAYPQLDEWRQRGRLAVKAVVGESADELKQWDKIRYSPTAWYDGMPSSVAANARRAGIREACGMLRALVEDIDEHLVEPELPSVDVGALHRWVADAASSLWADGHRRQAVQAAAAAVEQRLKLKLDVHTGPAASLVASAFAAKASAAGGPQLRFRQFEPEGSEQWANAHDGAGAFGRGCMLRIRNLYTHNTGATKAEDLEALAALSLLARWIDDADVERSPD